MILIQEIDREPDGPMSAESRSIVDEAFAICGPTGGLAGVEEYKLISRHLTEGGREAWDLLRHLRSKAWQKCGVDPDMLWTREQVIERTHEKAARSIAFPDEDSGPELPVHPASGAGPSARLGAIPQGADEVIVPGGVPTPNIDWGEWDTIIGDMQGGYAGPLWFGGNLS